MMDIILMILATWRISSLIADEDGPFDMFLKFREKLGVEKELDANGGIVILIPDRFAPKMVCCVWCISLWVGGIIYLLSPEQSPAFPFALSTGAIIIDNYLSGG